MNAPRARAYARKIEQEWSRMLERPIVLSPKDWALISDWHARQIPLALILESMRHAAERPGRRSAPRNLAYVAAAVEEAWGVVLEGRRDPIAPAPGGPPAIDAAVAWRRRVEAEPPDSPLGRLLDELLAAHAAGAPPGPLDGRLNERLITSVSADLLRYAGEQVDAKLAPFVERMDPLTLDRTRRAALVEALRRTLDLPVLDDGAQPVR